MSCKTLIAFAALLSAPALAQNYPTKPIRLLSTIAGGSEVLHRAMAQRVGEAMGQPIIFETQPAANGMVAAEATARAAPDGHTILLAVPGSMVVRGFLTRAMPYQPVKDFTPITMAAPRIFWGESDSPSRSPANETVKTDSMACAMDVRTGPIRVRALSAKKTPTPLKAAMPPKAAAPSSVWGN